MRSRLLPAVLLGLAASTAALAAEPPLILRVQAADAAVRDELGRMFGHIRYDATNGIATIEADALSRDRLARMGMSWEVDEIGTAAMKAYVEAGLSGLRAIPGFACYRTVEETFDTMDTLVASYPALASIVDIGDSWRRVQDSAEGHPMRVLRLGSNKIPGTKPIMFAVSSIHAREYTPAELMTRFAEQLLSGYGTDADSTWLLDHNEFHLLLHANPDGRKRAEQAVLWRKNENTNHCPQSNGNPDGNFHPGVDLNRNFPFSWAPASDQCYATYPGPTAASEPETQAIRDHLLANFPDTRPGVGLAVPADETTQGMFLDMHSYTGLVMWPWGTRSGGSPDITGNDAAFIRIGRRMAWFNNYVPQQSVALYQTRGTTIDFAYGELGVPGFTFELGTDFFQDCGTFQNTILPDNLASLRYAARTLHAPYLLPAGPDAYGLSAEPLMAIQGDPLAIAATIDDSRYQPGPGSAPVHAISGATVYIGTMPWQDGAQGLPMRAIDGSFDTSREDVVLDLDTTDLPPGRHLLVVQGHDAAGESGPPSGVFIDIKPNADFIFRHDFEHGGEPRSTQSASHPANG